MKKQRTIVLLCIILSFVYALEAFSEEEAGRVLAVKKKVYVIRNENRDDALPKMPLLMKDAVETEKKSRTKLFFTDDSILSLGEMSRVEVEEYLYNSEDNKSKSVYRLMDGYLKVIVGRSDLEIHTPTAVAAARGTKFIVVTGGTGKSAYTDVIVLNGMVDTWSTVRGRAAGMIRVGPGQSNRITMNKPPGIAKAAKPEALNQFAEKTVVAEAPTVNTSALPARVTPVITTPPPPPPPPSQQNVVQDQPPAVLPPTPVTIDMTFP
jgi:hypothetical protein